MDKEVDTDVRVLVLEEMEALFDPASHDMEPEVSPFVLLPTCVYASSPFHTGQRYPREKER